MSFLASLFVAHPLNILMVAGVFLAAYLTVRSTALGTGRHARPLLIATTAWGLYAAWEGLVQTATPEANIRVDLLVIWPVLGVVSVWALFRALR